MKVGVTRRTGFAFLVVGGVVCGFAGALVAAAKEGLGGGTRLLRAGGRGGEGGGSGGGGGDGEALGEARSERTNVTMVERKETEMLRWMINPSQVFLVCLVSPWSRWGGFLGGCQGLQCELLQPCCREQVAGCGQGRCRLGLPQG